MALAAHEILFVVSDYRDKITERQRAKIEKENVERASWKRAPLQAFSNRDDAILAILKRAKHELLNASKEVDRLCARLRKCEKKFGKLGDVVEM